MFSKSGTVLLQKSFKKMKKVLKKRYGPSKKSKKLKNVLEKRYGPSKKK